MDALSSSDIARMLTCGRASSSSAAQRACSHRTIVAYYSHNTCTGGTAGKGGNATESGVTGINALGVRELTYKLCFMACSTSVRPPLVLPVRMPPDLSRASGQCHRPSLTARSAKTLLRASIRKTAVGR